MSYPFLRNLTPGHLLLLCHQPPVSANMVCLPLPNLRFLFYFNQVAGKILEEVDGLILMSSHNNIHVEPPGLFCDL